MTLPEIPDEVLRDIRIEAPWLSEHDVHATAHTVWPHLYAAALRHAADELGSEDFDGTQAWLRRMADEAAA